MASTKNPFVSALEGFAVNPEAEARGQVLIGQTAKLGAETQILRDRMAARARMLDDPNTPTHIREMLLANDVINPTQATGATREFYGTNTLFPGGKPATNLTPAARSAAFAALGLNPNDNLVYGMEGNRGVAPTQAANQGDDWQFVKGTGGEPDLWVNKKTKEVTYASHSTQGPGLPYTEFNRNVVSTTPGVPSMVQTWKVGPKGEQTLVGERAVLPQGKESLNPTTLAQIMDYRRKMGVQNVGEAGLRYPGGQYAYMLDQKLNRLNEATGMPRTDRPALNPLTSRSIIDLANRLESAGYIPREAFEMALERHPEVIASIQAGKLEEKDFNDQGWLPGTWTDRDAGGNYLPNFGGSYLVPQGFTVKQGQTDYSNLAGRVPVPFVTRIAAQPDLASVVAAGTQVRPEFAEFMAPGFSADGLNVGSYYYSGTPNNPTFSVVRMVNGQRALVPVTGIGQ